MVMRQAGSRPPVRREPAAPARDDAALAGPVPAQQRFGSVQAMQQYLDEFYRSR